MSLLTEQEIRDVARSVKDIGENSDRALILAAQNAVIAKIKAQGPVAYISPSIYAFAGTGNGVAEFSYRPTGNRTIPLYKLPSEGDGEMNRQQLFNELATKVTAERSIDAVVLDEVLRLRVENKALKAELRSIDRALNDPRTNLTLTTAEVVWELKAEFEEYKKMFDPKGDKNNKT